MIEVLRSFVARQRSFDDIRQTIENFKKQS